MFVRGEGLQDEYAPTTSSTTRKVVSIRKGRNPKDVLRKDAAVYSAPSLLRIPDRLPSNCKKIQPVMIAIEIASSMLPAMPIYKHSELALLIWNRKSESQDGLGPLDPETGVATQFDTNQEEAAPRKVRTGSRYVVLNVRPVKTLT